MSGAQRHHRVSLIFIDSGGGHRAAATALRYVIEEKRLPMDAQMASIQDILDPVDFVRWFTGIRFQDVYNIMLRRGWTSASAQMIPLMHGLIRVSHRSQVRAIEAHWKRERPDLVVSMIPHYNRALKEALDHVWPGTPFVTLLTDIVDYPPHFWIEQVNQWVICGSSRAVEQAREIGIPGERILRASGMILNPAFTASMNINRERERRRLRLRPDLPIGLVLFGGEGSTEMTSIARSLNREDGPAQLILLCGKNEAVAAELRAMNWRIPSLVVGFTREVPFYMELSDFFIGKPGPGSLSEALAKGLPVIVQRNAKTLAHERYNTRWVEELGAGIVVRDFSRDIRSAVRTLLEPERFAEFRRAVKAVQNRAVYEIPEMLSMILEQYAEAPVEPECYSAPLARFHRGARCVTERPGSHSRPRPQAD